MNAMFSITFFLIVVGNVRSKPGINWCDKDSWSSLPYKQFQRAIQIMHTRQEEKNNRTMCYFYVRGAFDQCNVFDELYKFRFELDRARSICRRYSATLPTIRDSDDMVRPFDGPGRYWPVALGLLKVPGKAEIESWDDGTPGSKGYTPSTWKSADQHDNVTYVKENGEWESAAFVSHTFLNVICKYKVPA